MVDYERNVLVMVEHLAVIGWRSIKRKAAVSDGKCPESICVE